MVGGPKNSSCQLKSQISFMIVQVLLFNFLMALIFCKWGRLSQKIHKHVRYATWPPQTRVIPTRLFKQFYSFVFHFCNPLYLLLQGPYSGKQSDRPASKVQNLPCLLVYNWLLFALSDLRIEFQSMLGLPWFTIYSC